MTKFRESGRNKTVYQRIYTLVDKTDAVGAAFTPALCQKERAGELWLVRLARGLFFDNLEDRQVRLIGRSWTVLLDWRNFWLGAQPRNSGCAGIRRRNVLSRKHLRR
jgi:hypothetical protein